MTRQRTVEQVEFRVPDLTVKDLLAVIPIRDIGILYTMYLMTTYAERTLKNQFVLQPFLSTLTCFALWAIYGFAAGLVGTGLWGIAHECGHQAFSQYKPINHAVGWAIHSALGAPYHSWRITHARHHAATCHLTKDQTYIPHTRLSLHLPEFDPSKEDLTGTFVAGEVQEQILEALSDSPLFKAITYLCIIKLSLEYKDDFVPRPPLFSPHQRIGILLSDFGVLLWISTLITWSVARGFTEMFRIYLVPYLWVNHWLVLVTFLQHTDPLVPYYRDEAFTFLRGTLAALDRSLLGDCGKVAGWIGATLTHGVSETHVAHHVATKIPHYHIWEASDAIRKRLAEAGYNLQGAPGGWREVLRVMRECRFVEDTGDVVFYKNSRGFAAARPLRRFVSKSNCTRRFTTQSETSTRRVPRSKSYVWLKRTGYVLIGGVGIYAVDKQFNASSLARNFRTLYTGAVVAIDYKLNFQPGQAAKIMDLHERVAERLYNVLVENGGLYIKIGQALAANSALLPTPFQIRFSKLFDDAPQVPYSEIERVFMSEFGRPPKGENGVFAEFEDRAVASASIAQVHKAKLKKKEESESDVWVAVKVQKPAVSKQVNWDLAAYRVLMWIYENWVFDMPIYFLVDFISSHLRLELDFINEANNANTTARLIASEPELMGKVYVPKVYPEYTTSKIMTAEYIDGVKLSDRQAVLRLLDGSQDTANTIEVSRDPKWDGAVSPGFSHKPLAGGSRAIMDILIFKWGFVHCDPHPGNIIIRRRVPSNTPQLVLIDHGLYVSMPDELRRDYAQLWKGLLSGELESVKEIGGKWGIGKSSLDLLASGILLKPWKSNSQTSKNVEKNLDPYERSLMMKEKLRQFLTDTDRFPKALVFLGRNMRMIQGNNQSLGSPVNRVKIIGHWASRSLAHAPGLSLSQSIVERWRHFKYIVIIFSLDVAFWISKVRRWARGGVGDSFEDELEREMRNFSKQNFGFEIDRDAFTA
ncbi:hypothetical protein Clacol_007751 [Clathrus columnatus]|uniref:Uncharacterized protein n=1 Tax=Clathrus columnatus TaxID=1419009 RepID=A0AAV5AIH9_9AGAM|nr:hypothetical protein Clacol_007751 [Clathrus columnatus]